MSYTEVAPQVVGAPPTVGERDDRQKKRNIAAFSGGIALMVIALGVVAILGRGVWHFSQVEPDESMLTTLGMVAVMLAVPPLVIGALAAWCLSVCRHLHFRGRWEPSFGGHWWPVGGH